ncbi:MAG: hypothetical protein JSU61_08600 [Fidelibacterota bacterium]|nr:MAG: hypothetical protein JSU61_08600 [Candidatus Neomarinimicrobiota bacterium]
MADSLNLNDLFARFNVTSFFDRFERAEEPNPDQENEQAEEATRGNRGRGRGLFQAALARRGERAREAVRVDFSDRVREARPAEETREAERPEAPSREARAERATLRQQFRQAIQAFRAANQPAQAAGGEQQGGVAAPFNRPANQGAGPGTQGPTFQVGTPPTIVASNQPPRLDGIQMAASFQQTALGNALGNQSPIDRINPLTNPNAAAPGDGLNAGAGARPGGLALLGREDENQGGFGGAGQAENGPLARVQERLTNPGGALTADQGTPLAAGRGALNQGGIGGTQLNRGPLVEGFTPGGENAGNAPGAGMVTGNLQAAGVGRGAEQGANPPPPNTLAAGNEASLNQANAGPGVAPNDNAGFGPGAPAQNPPVTPNLLAVNNPGANLAGGGNAEAAGPGVAPPANPLTENQTDFPRNEPAAPLGGEPLQGGGPVGPALADVNTALAPEAPAGNPAPPTPEPPETPAEEAAAVRTSPLEAANTELRANVPRPILQPPDEDGAGRTPPGAAADAEQRGGAVPPVGDNQAAVAPAGAPTPAGPEAGGNEPATAPLAAVPAEGEEENGPAVAPPGGAEGRRAAAPLVEGPETEEGPAPAGPPEPEEEPGAAANQETARAIAAYEIQQMENRTNEPNEGRTVTELFVR